jgi:phosphatidylserine/phosphatidylglycerophosphate/cardiolipin synthase-like enzyme
MRIFALLTLIILLLGCSHEISEEKKISSERAPEPKMFFCPHDDCEKPLITLIQSAKESVHCAFFDIDLPNLTKALYAKSETHDIKLVVDDENKVTMQGKNVRKDTSSQYSHNKFCVIDGYIVTTGSFNPTENDAYKNNNNLIILYSKYLAKNYEEEFQELWNGDFGEGSPVEYPIIILNNKTVENYFCPEDFCSNQIIREINKAQKSIYFMTFSFTHEEIADAMLFKKKSMDIRGVFEKRNIKNSQYQRLKDFGINVKKDGNKYNLHHKVFIIDNETVITGSFNPSKNADTRNDENILIINNKKIAQKFLKEFDYVWNMAEK